MQWYMGVVYIVSEDSEARMRDSRGAEVLLVDLTGDVPSSPAMQNTSSHSFSGLGYDTRDLYDSPRPLLRSFRPPALKVCKMLAFP